MKNQRTLIKVLAAALLAGTAGLAAAAPGDSQSLTVTAQVPGVCRFSATSESALDFGTIDPTSTNPITKTANLAYRCTKNTVAPTIASTSATGYKMKSGGNELPYTLAIGATSAGTGFGASGTDLTAVVTGTITAAAFQTAAVGNDYTDTVMLIISP